MIARFIRDEAGATAIEYGLIAALIAVAIITALTTLGTALTRGVGAPEVRILIGISHAPGEEEVEIEVVEGPEARQVHVVDNQGQKAQVLNQILEP